MNWIVIMGNTAIWGDDGGDKPYAKEKKMRTKKLHIFKSTRAMIWVDAKEKRGQ